MLFAARERALAAQREALRVRSAALRARTASHAQVLGTPLRIADGVWTGWQWMRQHPEAVVAGVAVVVVFRPRRAWQLVRWAWRGWRAWLWVRRMSTAAAAG